METSKKVLEDKVGEITQKMGAKKNQKNIREKVKKWYEQCMRVSTKIKVVLKGREGNH